MGGCSIPETRFGILPKPRDLYQTVSSLYWSIRSQASSHPMNRSYFSLKERALFALFSKRVFGLLPPSTWATLSANNELFTFRGLPVSSFHAAHDTRAPQRPSVPTQPPTAPQFRKRLALAHSQLGPQDPEHRNQQHNKKQKLKNKMTRSAASKMLRKASVFLQREVRATFRTQACRMSCPAVHEHIERRPELLHFFCPSPPRTSTKSTATQTAGVSSADEDGLENGWTRAPRLPHTRTAARRLLPDGITSNT